jgi:hypothetical protein
MDKDRLHSARKQIFKGLWDHYFKLVPTAPKMVAAFESRNDLWTEDHVAFRTLPGEFTGSHQLQDLFEALGYSRKDDYRFADKKLNAFWLAPPDIHGHSHEASPKIFISELDPETFSPGFREVVRRYTSQVTASPLTKIKALSHQIQINAKSDENAQAHLIAECVAYLTSSPAWSRPTFADYQLLQKESEYASWTLLFGPQINHFTVSVHLMTTFQNIHQLAEYLEDKLKIALNKVGGVVKGTPDLLLEQIATLAASLDFPFQEGTRSVPYGFVEFAYRYPLAHQKADGLYKSYYQGFVTSNADKIFESTFEKK